LKRLNRRSTTDVAGVQVGRVALGTAAWALRSAPLGVGGAARVLAAAFDAGVGLVDTARAYASGDGAVESERLLGAALRRLALPPSLLVATKGGHQRDGDRFPVDGRPAALRDHCEASLRALGLDAVGLYFLHKPDPGVPIEESVGALAELREAGKIRAIGVSNVSLEELDRSRSVAAIAAVQNPAPDPGDPVLARCEETATAYLAYAPFAGGAVKTAAVGDRASSRGLSPHAVVVADLLSRSPALVAVVGASRAITIADSAAASA
jgi:aryl-alcohol dehydrogenase-like predicted oxidoreductase